MTSPTHERFFFRCTTMACFNRSTAAPRSQHLPLVRFHIACAKIGWLQVGIAGKFRADDRYRMGRVSCLGEESAKLARRNPDDGPPWPCYSRFSPRSRGAGPVRQMPRPTGRLCWHFLLPLAPRLHLFSDRDMLAVGREAGWIRARATAEGIKSGCYRLAARTGEYAGDDRIG